VYYLLTLCKKLPGLRKALILWVFSMKARFCCLFFLHCKVHPMLIFNHLELSTESALWC
jgi:hypothetical protein